MPQGLSFGASLPVASAVSIALGSQRIFCPFSLVLRAPVSHMSRGDELRQLAAQLSVLAALEDSIALGLSRVMRLLSLSRDWLRAWPPRVAHRSRLLSCAFPAFHALSTLPQSALSHLLTPLGPLHPPPRPPRPLVPRSLRPTPTTNGTLSLTHMASHRLLGRRGRRRPAGRRRWC